MNDPACPECRGIGWRDSGGFYPWGEAIELPCDCSPPAGRAMGQAIKEQRIAVHIAKVIQETRAAEDTYPNCHRCGKPIHPNIPCEEA